MYFNNTSITIYFSVQDAKSSKITKKGNDGLRVTKENHQMFT